MGMTTSALCAWPVVWAKPAVPSGQGGSERLWEERGVAESPNLLHARVSPQRGKRRPKSSPKCGA